MPRYAQCKIPYTSPAAKVTQQKTNKICIKDEIKYLYKKKDHLNTLLYKAHLQASNTWGKTWYVISNSIHESIKLTLTKKYQSLNSKLQHLKDKTHGKTISHTDSNRKFHKRVINLTNIKFTDDENKLLQKGLKYNLHSNSKHWVKTLAIEPYTSYRPRIRILLDIKLQKP
jgi:hypothetical protein